MTIKYRLTRAEILRVFFGGLLQSPRIAMVVLSFCLLSGAMWIVVPLVSGRSLSTRDALLAIAWTIGMFCFVIAMVFIRGKTEERTLSVSEQGISTQIGALDAQLPWTRVKEVKDSGTYILIVGRSGNSFFVPSRAFSGSRERSEFLSNVRRWHRTA